MFSGEQIRDLLQSLDFSHVVMVPDSTIGQWEDELSKSTTLRVVHVCREGEAWGVAAGLYLGGARPIIMIQCTGLFESGDALRNVLFDWGLPIPAVIGYRSYLNQDTLPGDTCLVYTEPVLDAWQLRYLLVKAQEEMGAMRDFLRRCRTEETPGVVLLAEGKA